MTTRRLRLIILGFGVTWHEVLHVALSRTLAAPPGLVMSLVGPGLLAAMLMPRYADWLRVNASRERLGKGDSQGS